MDLLNEIIIRSFINKTIEKIKFSLDDIKKNYPNRKDLIKSMDESLQEMVQVKVNYEELVSELKRIRLHTAGLSANNTKLVVRVQELEIMLSKAINNI